MKLKIGDRIYPVASQNDATLADLLAIKAATGLTRKDLRDVGERVAAMSEEEAQDSDEALLAMGITVWLSRRTAGEHLTLEEACSFPLHELEFIEEPGDAEALAASRAGVTPDPTSPDPAGSPRADGRPAAADRLPSKKKTSKRASTSA